jgi:flavin reductase (DIM6/NTAB) family NADH-FMN oxidoreductase RutF
MDILFGSDIANCFITNVGLVASNGPHGQNIMACEWTFHLSYRPAIIGIGINPRHATHDNIKATGEFAVCIASIHQSVLSSIAGRETGKTHDKIKVAESMGVVFSPAKTIDVLLPAGVAAWMECKLHSEIALGDHTLFAGEVVDGGVNASEKPIAYHSGRYWDMVSSLEKPSADVREKIKLLFTQNKK